MVSNNAKYPVVKTRPLNNELQELFASGYAIVSMLEKNSWYLQIDNPKATDILEYHNSGATNFLEALPCSIIKKGVCMSLFDGFNKSGMLFDAREVDHLIHAPNTISNTQHSDLNNQKFCDIWKTSVYPETDDMQGYGRPKDHRCKIDLNTSPEKNELVLKVMDKIWGLIEKDGIENFYFKTFRNDNVFPLVTEGLINVKDIERQKAIIFYSKQQQIEYAPIETLDAKRDFLSSVAYKGFLKHEFGLDLPLLHYRNSYSIVKNSMVFNKPELTELVLDTDKVMAAVKARKQSRHLCLKKLCEAAITEPEKVLRNNSQPGSAQQQVQQIFVLRNHDFRQV